MQTVQIPVEEYNKLVAQNQLLQQNELFDKINKVLDMLYESKYGFYMGDYTDDLTEYMLNQNYENQESPWDAI